MSCFEAEIVLPAIRNGAYSGGVTVSGWKVNIVMRSSSAKEDSATSIVRMEHSIYIEVMQGVASEREFVDFKSYVCGKVEEAKGSFISAAFSHRCPK